MDNEDPISQFFPGEESVDLYAVLSVDSKASTEDIKKSYRRHALLFHPDKHATSSEEVRADASTKFQQIGFAYTVLGDEKKRARYDRTGRTDEGFELEHGEDGWDAYFAELFDRVTKGKLDEMRKEYQGSAEETEDVKDAYNKTDGHIGEIMKHIPHSTFEDEPRFIILITRLIKQGDLSLTKAWESSVKDEKSKLVRKKQGEKEAKEAEKLAKDLGVWDEFYGSGKTGRRKGKGKSAEGQSGEDDDHSALQALILGKKKKAEGFFDSLAAKYAEAEPMASKGNTRNVKSKKRAKGNELSEEGDESPRKKVKKGGTLASPDIDDEEFTKLQQKLFGDKKEVKGSAGGSRKDKKTR